jgi:hypothetical protein
VHCGVQQNENMICVGHHNAQDSWGRQTKTTTWYVLDTTMHKTDDEDKLIKNTTQNATVNYWHAYLLAFKEKWMKKLYIQSVW